MRNLKGKCFVGGKGSEGYICNNSLIKNYEGKCFVGAKGAERWTQLGGRHLQVHHGLRGGGAGFFPKTKKKLENK